MGQVQNQNPSQSVFEDALSAAIAQRDQVRAEAEALTAKLNELKEMDANLSQTVTSLRLLLGVADASTERKEALERPAEITPAAEPQDESDELEVEHDGPPLPQPAGMKRGVASTSSPYLVGLILRDRQEPMKRDEIVEEYLRRGWRDPKWTSDPRNNIFQAIRRATNYGWAEQVPGEKQVYVTTQTSDDQPVAGDYDAGGQSP